MDQNRFAILAEVRGYWEALRGDGHAVPDRSCVDPRGMSGALDRVFIADRVAPGVARFRLAGAAISDLMGMDVRGMPMLTLIDPPDRTRFAKAIEAALTSPAILEMALEGERGIGRPALEARLIMLPLRRHDGSGGLSLGCLAIAGETGRSPRRFGIARESLTPLKGAAMPVPDRTPPPVAAPMPGLAEEAAPYAPPRPAHPHLRLVKSDRG
ncbi:MAG: PAS domain-containing protein [Gemmobacter sp.]